MFFAKNRRERPIPEIASSIPGMIEPAEQALLYRSAKSLRLGLDDCIVEFGSFLGKSGYCLAKGFIDSSSALVHRKDAAIRCYDSFSCAKSGPFYPHLNSALDSFRSRGFLQEANGVVDFKEAFEYFTHGFEKNVLAGFQYELADMYPIDDKKIKLVHLDLPKWYEDYKLIVERFFDRLEQGTLVIYQDFFYHWSATLVAAVQFWIDKGLLIPVETAATTLSTVLARRITEEDLLELDEAMSLNVASNIQRAIEYFSQFTVDRPDIFHSRLRLAKIQYLFELGDFEGVSSEFMTLQDTGFLQIEVVYNDFAELLKYGFSMRALYQGDH